MSFKRKLQQPTDSLPEPMIAALNEWAKQNPKIERVVVFGSRARGDARPDSDLDLAMRFVPEVDSTLSELITHAAAWCAELTNLLGVLVTEMELADDPDGGLYPAIRDEGVLIYLSERS